jgi:hypothetical protein
LGGEEDVKRDTNQLAKLRKIVLGKESPEGKDMQGMTPDSIVMEIRMTVETVIERNRERFEARLLMATKQLERKLDSVEHNIIAAIGDGPWTRIKNPVCYPFAPFIMATLTYICRARILKKCGRIWYGYLFSSILLNSDDPPTESTLERQSPTSHTIIARVERFSDDIETSDVLPSNYKQPLYRPTCDGILSQHTCPRR